MTFIGNEKISKEALATMRKRGGTWAAYENHDLGHRDLGHLRFLRYGEGCTFLVPPQRHPDLPREILWRYWFVGLVNTETGEITPIPECFKRKEATP